MTTYPHPMDDRTGFEATDEELGLGAKSLETTRSQGSLSGSLTATPSDKQAPVSLPVSAVASCCLNAALMLEIADQQENAAIRAANAGQAKLLRGAGVIADEMLVALVFASIALDRELEQRQGSHDPDYIEQVAVPAAKVRDAIARAEGRS